MSPGAYNMGVLVVVVVGGDKRPRRQKVGTRLKCVLFKEFLIMSISIE